MARVISGSAVVLGLVLAAGAAARAEERATGPDMGVTAQDVLRWRDAGATPDQLLTRVRIAPKVGRSTLADLEALTRAGVPAELVVLLLRRGADATIPAAPAAGPRRPSGTLRLRARGAFALHVHIDEGEIQVHTAHEGVEPDQGWFVIAPGAVQRVTLRPGPYLLLVDDVEGPRLRVPRSGVSAVVVDAPGFYAFAEAIAAGRTDEDPPAQAPRSSAERDSHETYAARWARVTPRLVQGYQGATAMVFAGWRTRRPAVPRWTLHYTRYPHDHTGEVTALVAGGGAVGRAIVVQEADRHGAHHAGRHHGHQAARTLVITEPGLYGCDRSRRTSRYGNVIRQDDTGRIIVRSTGKRWVYRLHR